MKSKAKNKLSHFLTLISIGTMSYIFADLLHEAIGHGLTSLILGNKITLLTSVYFRSETHSFVTDAFGPITNLLAGLTFWVVLQKNKLSNIYVQLLLVHTMAFNFFWFSWMCIYSGVTNKGDFAFYISGQTALLIWRILILFAGIVSYYLTFKLTVKATKPLIKFHDTRPLFSIPYLAACISALIAISFYKSVTFNDYYEAIVFPMFLPILLVPNYLRNETSDETILQRGQMKFIVSGLLLFVLFCMTLGQGICKIP